MKSDDDRGSLCAVLDPKTWENPGKCLHCDEEVTERDARELALEGIQNPITKAMTFTTRWLHRECAARKVLGGVLHVKRLCSCYIAGASHDTDPPGLTKREASREAVEAARRRGD